MRVFAAGFDQFGFGRVLSHIQQQDVSTSKGQEVIFEAVPLATHSRKGSLLWFFLVDNTGLGIEDVLRGRALSGLVGVDDIGGVPEAEGAVVHTCEDKSVLVDS